MNHTAALPDPDHTNPEHLRFACAVVAAACSTSEAWGLSPEYQNAVRKLTFALHGDADHIEAVRVMRKSDQ